jgi:type VI secretion system FHA domain protein
MRLLLSMLSWPDGAKPDGREIDTELAIGRGRDSGWILSDPASELSRRHCVLTPFGEGWRVVDVSANGTFINNSATPLGRENSYELHDGDRIGIGAYVIEVRYQAPASLQRSPVIDYSPFATPAARAPISGDAWLNLEAPPAHGGFGLPNQSDEHGFIGQPMPDHAPAMSDIWQPPAPSRVVIPDAVDFIDFASMEALPEPAESPPPFIPQAITAAAVNLAPVTAAVVPVEPARTAPVPAGAGDPVLLAAFLRGAGLRDTGDKEPVAMMEAVGAMMRTMVDRLRAVQAARGTIKREFRILATVVNPEDNNPIKFSPSSDAALHALLTGKCAPDRAVGEVLDEIRLHEVAMIAAMRDAVRGLLEALDPARLREQGQGLAMPIQRKARAFEQYEALHARTVQALADDFDSVFGKAFARAYERVALDEEATPRRSRR